MHSNHNRDVRFKYRCPKAITGNRPPILVLFKYVLLRPKQRSDYWTVTVLYICVTGSLWLRKAFSLSYTRGRCEDTFIISIVSFCFKGGYSWGSWVYSQRILGNKVCFSHCYSNTFLVFLVFLVPDIKQFLFCINSTCHAA